MALEQSHDNSLESETEAGRMSDRAISSPNIKRRTEVILVKIKGADGSRIREGDYRDQNLEFQAVLPLVHREHLARATEEGVGRHIGFSRQAE